MKTQEQIKEKIHNIQNTIIEQASKKDENGNAAFQGLSSNGVSYMFDKILDWVEENWSITHD